MRDLFNEVKSFAEQKFADYTQGMTFPATKDQILAHARENHMPQEIIDRLEKLPDKQFNSISELVISAVEEK